MGGLCIMYAYQRIEKGELGRLFFTPVLMLWGGGHFDGHVWRRVIVPPDLAWLFSAICAHYRCCLFYRAITCKVRVRKGNTRLTKLLGRLSCKKSGGTITCLHMWWQDGCHNRFPIWISLGQMQLLTIPFCLAWTEFSKRLCDHSFCT